MGCRCKQGRAFGRGATLPPGTTPVEYAHADVEADDVLLTDPTGVPVEVIETVNEEPVKETGRRSAKK